MTSQYKKICPQCNKEFICAHKNQKRCSWACMGKSYSNSVAKSCLKCGKEFLVQPHRIKTGRGKFCSKKCCDDFKIVFFRRRHGYIHEYAPDHPQQNKLYVPQHRLIMEKHIGRYLKPKEVVHHINEIRDDNRIENLMIFASEGDHQFFHWNALKSRKDACKRNPRKKDAYGRFI